MARKRKAGDGTLRLRKDGRWEGRVVVGYDEKGLPKTKNVLAKTKAECLEKLDQLKAECGVVVHRAKPDMPFGDWLDLWYKTWSKPTIRLTTQTSYEGQIYLHIIPSIGNIPLNKLQTSDLQQFYSELKKCGRRSRVDLYGPGLSDRMVRACHAVCHMALEKAVAEVLIPANPAKGCKLPPAKAAEMQVLTPEEMRRFLIQAKQNDFYEIAILELATGMRRGEISALKWSDLDFETGALHIQRQVIHLRGQINISAPKTAASYRTVILPREVVDILKELRTRTDSEWMFPSPVNKDNPMDPQSIYHTMKKVLMRAQCRDVRFHDLRHTFATTSLEHGMDIKTLSAIIGHVRSATTINIYSHITDTMQIHAANRIEKAIGDGEPAKAYPTPIESVAETEPPQRFTPYMGKIRKSGTGGIYQINDHLYEGRYTHTNAEGKREVHTVYAKTREECEQLLNEMIPSVRARIQAEKAATKGEIYTA